MIISQCHRQRYHPQISPNFTNMSLWESTGWRPDMALRQEGLVRPCRKCRFRLSCEYHPMSKYNVICLFTNLFLYRVTNYRCAFVSTKAETYLWNPFMWKPRILRIVVFHSSVVCRGIKYSGKVFVSISFNPKWHGRHCWT